MLTRLSTSKQTAGSSVTPVFGFNKDGCISLLQILAEWPKGERPHLLPSSSSPCYTAKNSTQQPFVGVACMRTMLAKVMLPTCENRAITRLLCLLQGLLST